MSIFGWYKIERGRWSRCSARGLTGIEIACKMDANWFGFWYEPYCGHSDNCHVHFGVWPLHVYLRFPGKGHEQKRWGMTLSWNTFQLWRGSDPDHDDSSKGIPPVYFRWRDRLLDLLFGKTVFLNDRGHEWASKKIEIQMPEGLYIGRARFEKAVWFRPRWPFRKLRLTTDVDMPKGIPFMGKGENSWDCGDDGLFGFSVEGHDLAKAAAHGRDSVLKSRLKYGEPSKYHPDIPSEVHSRTKAEVD